MRNNIIEQKFDPGSINSTECPKLIFHPVKGEWQTRMDTTSDATNNMQQYTIPGMGCWIRRVRPARIERVT